MGLSVFPISILPATFVGGPPPPKTWPFPPCCPHTSGGRFRELSGGAAALAGLQEDTHPLPLSHTRIAVPLKNVLEATQVHGSRTRMARGPCLEQGLGSGGWRGPHLCKALALSGAEGSGEVSRERRRKETRGGCLASSGGPEDQVREVSGPSGSAGRALLKKRPIQRDWGFGKNTTPTRPTQQLSPRCERNNCRCDMPDL